MDKELAKLARSAAVREAARELIEEHRKEIAKRARLKFRATYERMLAEREREQKEIQ